LAFFAILVLPRLIRTSSHENRKEADSHATRHRDETTVEGNQ